MFAAVEGLRALGALSVATSHSWPNAIKNLSWFHGSFLVVEMFFVLSGYLVTKVYAERVADWRDAGALAIERLGRLYPMHLAVLIVWILLFYGKQMANEILLLLGVDLGMTPASQQLPFDAGYLLMNLFMLHGIGIQDSLAYNYPAWSISVDFWSFVIVVGLFMLAPQRPVRIRLALAGLSMCALHAAHTWWSIGMPSEQATPMMFKVLTRGATAYFIGMLAFEWQRHRRLPESEILHTALQLTCMALLLVVVPNQQVLPFNQFYACAIWAVLIVSLSEGRGLVATLLSCPALVWLGKRSFSMYMTHALLLMLFQRRLMAIDDVTLSTVMLFIYLGAAIVIAHLSHRLIEERGYAPFLALARRLQATRPRAASPRQVAMTYQTFAGFGATQPWGRSASAGARPW